VSQTDAVPPLQEKKKRKKKKTCAAWQSLASFPAIGVSRRTRCLDLRELGVARVPRSLRVIVEEGFLSRWANTVSRGSRSCSSAVSDATLHRRLSPVDVEHRCSLSPNNNKHEVGRPRRESRVSFFFFFYFYFIFYFLFFILFSRGDISRDGISTGTPPPPRQRSRDVGSNDPPFLSRTELRTYILHTGI